MRVSREKKQNRGTAGEEVKIQEKPGKKQSAGRYEKGLRSEF